MEADRLLDGLDPDQRAAVTAPATSTVVIAGAGSGKTRVLTHRIAWRIATGNAVAERVLAITFTRQAAAELRRRLAGLNAAGIRRSEAAAPTIGTFHAVALQLVRQRIVDDGSLMPSFVTNRAALMAAALDTNPVSGVVRDALAEVDWAHARNVGPEVYEREALRVGRTSSLPTERVVDAYRAYERLKKRRGLVDLDDLLIGTLTAMRERPNYAEAVRWRFRHIFVDEAQDMNPLQYALFDALRGGRPDVFVVGDPMQAIYGWNGAERRLFDELPDRIPGTTVVTLPNNYRCSPQVIDTAVAVSRHSGQSARVRPVRRDGAPVRRFEYFDEADEARGVVAIISRHIERFGGHHDDFAVLARTNAQLEPVREELRRAGIPVRTQRSSTTRSAAIAEIAECADRHELAVWATDTIIETDDPHERAIAEALQSFLGQQQPGVVNGRAAAAWLMAGEAPTDATGVELLTFHAAKGREFPGVIVTGVEAGLIPHSSAGTDTARAEEARLAYVAVTRAADFLYLTSATRRKRRATKPSPYFDGIGTDNSASNAEVAQLPRNTYRRQPTDDDKAAASLRTMREQLARAARRSPTTVLSDDEIRRIVARRPVTIDDLEEILGAMTARRLAPAILQALHDDSPQRTPAQ
ncbi:MAG: ATP-dependent helicase [Ilumatobacteraceae bacterium]